MSYEILNKCPPDTCTANCDDGKCVDPCPNGCPACHTCDPDDGCVPDYDTTKCETCNKETCEVESSCDPTNCEICDDGKCVSTCTGCFGCSSGGTCTEDTCGICDVCTDQGSGSPSTCEPKCGTGVCDACDSDGNCYVDTWACPARFCLTCPSSGGNCEFLCTDPCYPVCKKGFCDVGNLYDPQCFTCTASSSGNADIQPICDACEICDKGNCRDNCKDPCESCVNGKCEYQCDPKCEYCDSNTCKPKCDPDYCETCNSSGECQSTCKGCETCRSGTCVPEYCSNRHCEKLDSNGCCVGCDSTKCEKCVMQPDGGYACEPSCTKCDSCQEISSGSGIYGCISTCTNCESCRKQDTKSSGSSGSSGTTTITYSCQDVCAEGAYCLANTVVSNACVDGNCVTQSREICGACEQCIGGSCEPDTTICPGCYDCSVGSRGAFCAGCACCYERAPSGGCYQVCGGPDNVGPWSSGERIDAGGCSYFTRYTRTREGSTCLISSGGTDYSCDYYSYEETDDTGVECDNECQCSDCGPCDLCQRKSISVGGITICDYDCDIGAACDPNECETCGSSGCVSKCNGCEKCEQVKSSGNIGTIAACVSICDPHCETCESSSGGGKACKSICDSDKCEECHIVRIFDDNGKYTGNIEGRCVSKCSNRTYCGSDGIGPAVVTEKCDGKGSCYEDPQDTCYRKEPIIDRDGNPTEGFTAIPICRGCVEYVSGPECDTDPGFDCAMSCQDGCAGNCRGPTCCEQSPFDWICSEPPTVINQTPLGNFNRVPIRGVRRVCDIYQEYEVEYEGPYCEESSGKCNTETAKWKQNEYISEGQGCCADWDTCCFTPYDVCCETNSNYNQACCDNPSCCQNSSGEITNPDCCEDPDSIECGCSNDPDPCCVVRNDPDAYHCCNTIGDPCCPVGTQNPCCTTSTSYDPVCCPESASYDEKCCDEPNDICCTDPFGPCCATSDSYDPVCCESDASYNAECCGLPDGPEIECCLNPSICCNEDQQDNPCCAAVNPDPCCESDPCCLLTGLEQTCCRNPDNACCADNADPCCEQDPCCLLTGREQYCCKYRPNDPCCSLTGKELTCCRNPLDLCCSDNPPDCCESDPCCNIADPVAKECCQSNPNDPCCGLVGEDLACCQNPDNLCCSNFNKCCQEDFCCGLTGTAKACCQSSPEDICCGLQGDDLICCRDPNNICCGNNPPECCERDKCCGSTIDPECCGIQDHCCGLEGEELRCCRDPNNACCATNPLDCCEDDPCCGITDAKHLLDCCKNPEDPCCGLEGDELKCCRNPNNPCCGTNPPECCADDPCCGLEGTDLYCCRHGSSDKCCGLVGNALLCCKDPDQECCNDASCCGDTPIDCCGIDCEFVAGCETRCESGACIQVDPCCGEGECCGIEDPNELFCCQVNLGGGCGKVGDCERECYANLHSLNPLNQLGCVKTDPCCGVDCPDCQTCENGQCVSTCTDDEDGCEYGCDNQYGQGCIKQDPCCGVQCPNPEIDCPQECTNGVCLANDPCCETDPIRQKCCDCSGPFAKCRECCLLIEIEKAKGNWPIYQYTDDGSEHGIFCELTCIETKLGARLVKANPCCGQEIVQN